MKSSRADSGDGTSASCADGPTAYWLWSSTIC